LKAQGKYDEALEHLIKVVKRHSRDVVARNERGHLYLLKRDYKMAVRDFEKVLRIDPENLEAYYHLTVAYRAMGEIEKANKAQAFYNRRKASGRLFSAIPLSSVERHVIRERQLIHEHDSVALPFDQHAAGLPATDGKNQPANR
jgi:tetratricopeptide (TPR) repeat protein